VIGYVRQSDHARHTRSKQRLDTLAHCHFREAATLTPPFKTEADPTFFDLDNGCMSAVRCDDRIDLAIEHAANGRSEIRLLACCSRPRAWTDHPYARHFREALRINASMRARSGTLAPGDPVTSRVTIPLSTVRTRISPPRAITEGNTLACSAAVTLAVKSTGISQ
jgi:hypothetical protein